MTGTDVQTTLREMWETRPSRPRHDRKIAGVAAAIARRYDIDPVLVRVGFVVAALYGIGVALYLAGWVLLPPAREDDPTDGAGVPGTAGTNKPAAPHPLLMLGLVIVLIVGSGMFFGRDGGVLLPALAVFGLLFLLHRARGDRGPTAPAHPGTAAGPPAGDPKTTAATASTAPTAPTDGAQAPAGGADAPTRATGAAAPAGGSDGPTTERDPVTGQPRRTPPSWDPLGAAPFAWDLPEPSPAPAPPAPPARRRSKVTAVTLALALLTGGVLGSLLLLGHGVTTLPVLFGIVLVILGAGLVIGSFVRGGRGLIPFALLTAVLTWGSMVAPLSTMDGGIGDTRAAPTAITVLAPEYQRAIGSIELDLRHLDLSVPPGTDPADLPPVRTSASVGVGHVLVQVPANADLTIHGSAGAGNVEFGTQRSDGPRAALTITDDLGADGVRSGRPLELELRAGLGEVLVQRG
ncbi:PspC domain-containing protein [Pseudonocardia asaccharolytica]|uniref:PspC family transcriptional regulator n=1 Tax=Pseudonocardia asaccharolytica DSM 44247 = NBRC 16224 TaxID=1123024 RepID=A0A511CUG0_9PSEU|nr:PspC domain-containing protein [Pseudonocardia asaccharolytica]GEL16216.1 PspC family transcriptional regulator [Pseudonocardia asaccharolytica DSM 44247 = NBRC 16224]